MDELRNTVKFYEADHKRPGSSTSRAEYGGKAVIVKQGGEEVRHEADILRQIDSTYIPKVIKYIEKDTGNYLILEDFGGESLSKTINLRTDWRSTPVPKEESIATIRDIAHSFREVISAGFYYRDLNLSHILLTENSVKLVDHEADVKFDASGEAVVDSLAGTWETMSPEEFEVGSRMTEASQVFTLGTVLLQLVAGYSHFYINPEEIEDPADRRRATKDKMRKFSGIATNEKLIDEVINKSLNFDASRRFTSVSEFLVALGV